MGSYIIRRFFYMIPTLLVISIIAFVVIQLPPGDFLTTYITRLEAQGTRVTESRVEALEKRYGLNQPLFKRYFKWIGGIIFRGDFGMSFYYSRPVRDILLERIPYTVLLSGFSLLFTWLISLPIGIYSAVKQYSLFDYFFTFSAFIGRSIPNFLLALVLMYLCYTLFGWSIGGLFSQKYAYSSWSLPKVFDLLKHLVVPIIVIGTARTAGLVRTLRATTLDELGKDYVKTARSKGLRETWVVVKHIVPIAMNPLFSTIGWILPGLIGGAMISAIVLSLPTTGPVMYTALLNQDMYLAGSFLLIISALTVFGTLVSDIILAVSDPRIRYE